MLGFFKKEEPIEKFWKWFSANEKQYRNFQDDPDRYLTELISRIKKISDGLAVELQPPIEGVINMTISADGNVDLFPIVKQIVDKAPAIEGWHFYAFRQRMPADQVEGMILKAEGHELNPSKMKFFPIISGDTLDIIVYADDVTENNREQVAYGCLMLLDNLLGEYDCVKKVRSYDFHPMPHDQHELQQLKPLIEVAQYVDGFHAKNISN